MNQLYFQIADTKNQRLAMAPPKFFIKVLIEHQGPWAQINEFQPFFQRPVWTDESEFSKYAIVIEDKRNGSAPLCVESFQRARKKDDNQQEDLSPYESCFIQTNLARDQMRETEAWQPSQPVNSVKVRASNGGFYALNYRSFVIRHFPLPSELSVG